LIKQQLPYLYTGFLIGNHGYALTAAHVIDQLLEDYDSKTDAIAGMFVDSHWNMIEILEMEKHPSEDIGIIRLPDYNWTPIVKIDPNPKHSSVEYICWGYPHEVANEVTKLDDRAFIV